jgi:ribonuclease BN (tRNA processing enzyme)
MKTVDRLRQVLSALPDTEQTLSRFGSHRSPAWSVRGREFAHLHADHLLDLRLPRAVQAGLRSDPKAHFRKSASEWLELEFHTAEDVAHIAELALEAWTAAKDS